MTPVSQYIDRHGQSDIPSPCSGVCRMDALAKLCEGCLRTVDEIAQWRNAGETHRLAIWGNIRIRAANNQISQPCLEEGATV